MPSRFDLAKIKLLIKIVRKKDAGEDLESMEAFIANERPELIFDQVDLKVCSTSLDSPCANWLLQKTRHLHLKYDNPKLLTHAQLDNNLKEITVTIPMD